MARNVTIDLDNSFSTIKGVDKELFDQLKQALTYVNKEVTLEKGRILRQMSQAKAKGQNKYFYALKGQLDQLPPPKVCWMSASGKFPTGLIYKIKSYLDKLLVQYSVNDKRIKPKNRLIMRWENPSPKLRYYQEEMLELARHNERGVFVSAVGSGKSLVITNIIKEHAVNTLIVVPSLALQEQLYRTLKHHFGSKNVEVLNSAAVKKAKKFKPIIIMNIQSLSALQKSGDIDKLLKEIQMFIVDEVHHSGAKSFCDLLPNINHIYYKYGFTGTFTRNDSKTMDMHGFLSNVLYEYSPEKATAEGYLTPVNYHVHKVKGHPSFSYQKEYSNNYCGNIELLKKIESIIASIPKDDQILILVERKEKSGAVIHDVLKRQGIENIYISGDNTKEDINNAIEDFNSKKIKILIGSSVIGEGVDVHSTQHLILATGGKSEIKMVQSCGRAVRLSEGKVEANIHDFLFLGTRYLQKHLYERLEIFKEHFNGKVFKDDVE